MSQKHTVKPLAACLGAVLVGSVTGAAVASTADNPFGMSELSSGYMQLAAAEGKCGGEMKAGAEGKCGEGKCGGEMKTGVEGKCGEGKFEGEMKPGAETTSGEAKGAEGKCGGAK